MSLLRWLAPLMILLALDAPAFAEAADDEGSDAEQVTAPPPPPPPVAPKRRSRRRVATAEAERTADRFRAEGELAPERDRDRQVDFTGGINAGYSGLSGTPTAGTGSSVLSSNGYHHPSLGLGAVADLRALKYLGVEGEGFLGIRALNHDPTTSTTVSRSITGFAFDVKGQYPFAAGATTITPKAGVGYGWTQLIESTAAGTASERSSVTRMTGFYAIGGVDFVPYRDWLVSVDYLHNFTADGGVPNAADPSTSLQSVVAGNYDRLRAGVFYRFAPHFVAGAQYVRRTYDFGLASTAVTTTTTTTFTPTATDGRVLHLDQALATFLFEL